MSSKIPVKPVQPNQSIENAVACLFELTSAGEPVGCVEMAHRLGVERTKASRIMGTLAHLGMAQRLPDLRYIPGPGMHLLSTMALRSSGLLTSALPHIERMRARWGTHAALGVVWRRQVTYLYHSGLSGELHEAIGGHDLFPANISCVGRVILATQEDDDVRERFGDNLTATEYRTLFTSIKGIRKEGALVEKDSIAMAIGSPSIAGIAFFNPSPGTGDPTVIKEVEDIVADISQKINSTPSTPSNGGK